MSENQGIVTVYITIGNTDNKLTQQVWSQFVADTRYLVRDYAEYIHGNWFSLPHEPYQNAIFGFDIESEWIATFQGKLRVMAAKYKQESIAWSTAEVHMVRAMLKLVNNVGDKNVDSKDT